MLVFDVFDNGIPTERVRLCRENTVGSPSVIVDLITIAWCVNNVQPQTNTILFNDYSLSV